MFKPTPNVSCLDPKSFRCKCNQRAVHITLIVATSVMASASDRRAAKMSRAGTDTFESEEDGFAAAAARVADMCRWPDQLGLIQDRLNAERSGQWSIALLAWLLQESQTSSRLLVA